MYEWMDAWIDDGWMDGSCGDMYTMYASMRRRAQHSRPLQEVFVEVSHSAVDHKIAIVDGGVEAQVDLRSGAVQCEDTGLRDRIVAIHQRVDSILSPIQYHQ